MDRLEKQHGVQGSCGHISLSRISPLNESRLSTLGLWGKLHRVLQSQVYSIHHSGSSLCWFSLPQALSLYRSSEPGPSDCWLVPGPTFSLWPCCPAADLWLTCRTYRCPVATAPWTPPKQIYCSSAPTKRRTKAGKWVLQRSKDNAVACCWW